MGAASQRDVDYDDDIAAMYDKDSHGIYRASHDDVIAIVGQGRGYRRILDVGAGTGTVLHRLQQALSAEVIYGLEPSAAMLQRAASKVPGMIAVHGDDKSLLTDERLRDLDLVLANFVLTYSPAEQLIGRVAQTLKPGGDFAVTTTTLNSFQELYRLAFHPIFRVFSLAYNISPATVEANLPPLPKSPDVLCRQLEAGGFDVIETKIRQHVIRFANGRALYDFGREGGWWLDLYQRLGVTSRSVPWMHLALRACTTTMETCTVLARRR
jgi:trans-aconitate methyltransferase